MSSKIDAAIAADACVPAWRDLLSNGDFEREFIGWSEVTGGSSIVRDTLPFNAHSGSWGALLLGYSNADTALTQRITIPGSATQLRLSLFRCWVTTETSNTTAFDDLSIEIRDTNGAVLETLIMVSNLEANATCNWNQSVYPALGSYAGTDIDLVFHGTSDGSSPTSFVFDTMSFDVFGCPP